MRLDCIESLQKYRIIQLGLLQRMDARPTLDERIEDEILGYDQDGIPASLPKDGNSGGH